MCRLFKVDPSKKSQREGFSMPVYLPPLPNWDEDAALVHDTVEEPVQRNRNGLGFLDSVVVLPEAPSR